ncbi:MAG: geranylgeranylglyceryl/heptaprenylglyceryl phosphate synthase [Lewinellaceae bacterium]|nr:geranylgeranylglyceryl/heptaprenylglyceryl phosphate synthase [Lewinellaceae bacterium]
MGNMQVYPRLQQAYQQGQKQLALLIDPDGLDDAALERLLDIAAEGIIDYLFLGGSLMVHDRLDHCLLRIRQRAALPIVLFPGSPLQIHPGADAILFLSLISGRNPELLIGQHVIAAPYIRDAGLETIPTGYMLIDGGAPTTASYMSNTLPLPADKPAIAVCTALAGTMLGLQVLYLDAGSGARQPVPVALISAVRDAVNTPLIIGGGIRTPQQAQQAWAAGADVLVVGNAVERNPVLLAELAATKLDFAP